MSPLTTRPLRAASALLALLGLSAQADFIELVSLSGDKIGPGNAYTFEGYSLPALDQNGTVAFAANLAELDAATGDRFESVIHYATGAASIVALEDGLAPRPGGNGIFSFLEQPAIDATGRVLFRGKLSGGSNAVDLQGVWAATVSGGVPALQMLARSADRPSIDYAGAQPNNNQGRLKYLGNPIPAGAAFAYIADLEQGAYAGDHGLWLQDATAMGNPIPVAKLVARADLALPGQTLQIDEPLAFTPNGAASGALLATLVNTGSVGPLNDLALFRTNLANPAALAARTGDTAPGSAATFIGFGPPAINANGNIAFQGSLGDAAQTEGLYLHALDTLSRLADTNAPLVASGVSLSFDSFDNPVINAAGEIAILGSLDSGAGQALVKRSPAGQWTLVARSGQAAPDTAAGVTFQAFGSPLINAAGQLAFSATLQGQGDIISDTTDTGIWATDINGTLVSVIREGDTAQLKPGVVRAIASAAIGGFSDANKLALRLGLTDSSTAIVLMQAETAGPPAITAQPVGVATYAGESVTLSVAAANGSPFTYQWYRNGAPVNGATAASHAIPSLSSSTAGSYHVVVTSASGSTASAAAAVTSLPLPAIPAFVEQPLGDVVTAGGQATLTSRAVATGTIAYQWYKDGQAIAGATSKTLVIPVATSDDDGSYHVLATTSSGSAQSAAAEIAVLSSRMIGISSRAYVGTDANVLISGIFIDGAQPKTVIIRGLGPSMQAPTIENKLAQPRLDLYSNGQIIATNGGWAGLPNQAEIAAAVQTAKASAIPNDSDDAAILATLNPGLYSVILSGENRTTGVALLEVYEVGPNASELAGLSSRAYVGVDAEILITGFAIEGDSPQKTLVQAVGPSLPSDVAGRLARPHLQLVNLVTLQTIATNSGWETGGQAAAITAARIAAGGTALIPGNQDAALLVDLPPGNYGVLVSGVGATTGVSLIEAYRVPE